MARPIKDGLGYFPHDVDASNDEKIEIISNLYGNDGYAFYFRMLERIYNCNGCILDVSDVETRAEIFLILSIKIKVSLEKFEKMLSTCFKYGLFDKKLYETEWKITSNGIQKRANNILVKRAENKERYNKYKSKQKQISETTQETITENNVSGGVSAVLTTQETSPENTQIKENKTKLNQTKLNQIKSNHQKDDCDFVADDDDDFDEDDLKTDDDNVREEPKNEARAILLDQGIGGETAKTILNKFNEQYIEFKIKQILEMNKSGSIKNLKAYILKSFANTDQDTADNELCAFLSEERGKEEVRKPKMNPELERMKKQQEQDEKFIQETELLVLNATEKDKQTFIETVIEPSNMYKQSFNRGGFENGFVSVLFRTFLQNKYKEAK